MPILRRPARQTIRAAIFVKTVPAGALGNNRAIFVIGKIVDPRTWGDRVGHNVLKPVGRKMTVFHALNLSLGILELIF